MSVSWFPTLIQLLLGKLWQLTWKEVTVSRCLIQHFSSDSHRRACSYYNLFWSEKVSFSSTGMGRRAYITLHTEYKSISQDDFSEVCYSDFGERAVSVYLLNASCRSRETVQPTIKCSHLEQVLRVEGDERKQTLETRRWLASLKAGLMFLSKLAVCCGQSTEIWGQPTDSASMLLILLILLLLFSAPPHFSARGTTGSCLDLILLKLMSAGTH